MRGEPGLHACPLSRVLRYLSQCVDFRRRRTSILDRGGRQVWREAESGGESISYRSMNAQFFCSIRRPTITILQQGRTSRGNAPSSPSNNPLHANRPPEHASRNRSRLRPSRRFMRLLVRDRRMHQQSRIHVAELRTVVSKLRRGGDARLSRAGGGARGPAGGVE